MSDNERIQLVISGLDLAPGDDGPDDAIRMLRASGFAGQAVSLTIRIAFLRPA
jgi:hypothetical protein